MATVKDLTSAVRAVPPAALARALATTPLELQAARLLEALPTVELVTVTGPISFHAQIATISSRLGWSLGAAEQVVLRAIVTGRGVTSAFAIRTFNGGTTRVLA